MYDGMIPTITKAQIFSSLFQTDYQSKFCVWKQSQEKAFVKFLSVEKTNIALKNFKIKEENEQLRAQVKQLQDELYIVDK